MAGPSAQDILRSFKENLMRLCDDLVEMLPHDSDLIAVRMFAHSLPLVQAMEVFANATIPFEKQIFERDEKYFLNMEGDMFTGFETGKVNKFKDVYLSNQITSDHKSIIWNYFTYFLQLAIKYRKITNDNKAPTS